MTHNADYVERFDKAMGALRYELAPEVWADVDARYQALRKEFYRLADETMRYQVGQEYEVGYTHGVAAGLAQYQQPETP